jgi:hypothetical protein
MQAFEPTKYITSLIAAVNDGAKSAQLGALAFTAIGLFLLATAFSATDEDLLLNRALTISQLGGTAVPVVFAFGLAPAVFVAVHFYTLIRYDMLAGNQASPSMTATNGRSCCVETGILFSKYPGLSGFGAQGTAEIALPLPRRNFALGPRTT